MIREQNPLLNPEQPPPLPFEGPDYLLHPGTDGRLATPRNPRIPLRNPKPDDTLLRSGTAPELPFEERKAQAEQPPDLPLPNSRASLVHPDAGDALLKGVRRVG